MNVFTTTENKTIYINPEFVVYAKIAETPEHKPPMIDVTFTHGNIVTVKFKNKEEMEIGWQQLTKFKHLLE